MAVNNAGRTTVDFNDWMRNIEKRLMREERRPSNRSARDLVGPGIAPYARQVNDWNSEGPQVNGFFFSIANQVVNSPDDTLAWIGQVFADPFNRGVQRIQTYLDGDGVPSVDPPVFYTRVFAYNPDGTRTFTAWA